MPLTPGAVVAERYLVERKIGGGGMGEVWSGEHLTIGARVALKTLLPATAADAEVIARFRREARLLGSVQSDHVARAFDFVSDLEHGPVLVMEFVEGRSLADRLSERCLGVEEAVDVGVGIARGLVDLHRARIVHRDLKPGNVILRQLSEGGRRAVIVDFGLGRLVDREADEADAVTRITRSNVTLGTVEYMAPEQVLNSRDATEASDVYALGAILFRAVSGAHVFGDVDVAEMPQTKIRADAPPLLTRRADPIACGLEAVVARALRRRPAERYASAAEMLADLAALRDIARSGIAGEGVEESTSATRLTPTQLGRVVIGADVLPEPSTPAVARRLPAPEPLADGLTLVTRPRPAAAAEPEDPPGPPRPRRRTALLGSLALAVLAGTIGAAIVSTRARDRLPAESKSTPVAPTNAPVIAVAATPAAPQILASDPIPPERAIDLGELEPSSRPSPSLRAPTRPAPAVSVPAPSSTRGRAPSSGDPYD